MSDRGKAADPRQRPASRIGDWIFETNEILELTFVSDRFTTTTGLDPDHIVGWTLPSLMLSDPSAGKGEGRTFNLDDHRPFEDMVCSLKRPDGEILHFSVSASPYAGPAGNFLGYRGVGHNITRNLSKSATNAAADTSTQAILKDLDESGDALIAYGTDGAIMFCNDAYRTLYPDMAHLLRPGVMLRDVLGESARLAGVSGDGKAAEKWIEQRLHDRLHPSGEMQEHYISGRWWQIHEYAALDGTVINRRRDVTAERAKSDATGSRAAPSGGETVDQRARSMLAEVIDALEEGFALFDEDLCLVAANARYAKMLDINPATLVPGAFFAVILVDLADRALPDASSTERKDWLNAQLTARRDPASTETAIGGKRLRLTVRHTPTGLLAHTVVDIGSRG